MWKPFLLALTGALAIFAVAEIFSPRPAVPAIVEIALEPACENDRTPAKMRTFLDFVSAKYGQEYWLSPPIVVDAHVQNYASLYLGDGEGWIFTFVDGCGAAQLETVSAEKIEALMPPETAAKYRAARGVNGAGA
jgi:hypothetical protein